MTTNHTHTPSPLDATAPAPQAGGTTLLTMPNGDTLECDYPDDPSWAKSWTSTDPRGRVATQEQDWEIVERYGLTDLFEAFAAALSRSPAVAPEVPAGVVRAAQALIAALRSAPSTQYVNSTSRVVGCFTWLKLLDAADALDAALAPDAQAGAVADIGRLTGGDGEYVCSMGVPSERHCPNVETMTARIVDRFIRLAASGAAPAGGLPEVEAIAEAVYEVDGIRPGGLSWIELRDSAKTSDYHRHVRSVVLENATAIHAHLAASETANLSNLRADRSTLDEPIPDFDFTPGAFIAYLRQAVADDKGLTIILPARSTRDMLAWAEGVASGMGDAGRSVAVKTVTISPDPERAYTLAEMDGLVAAMEPTTPPTAAGMTDGEPVRIAYTNWRGEETTPTILPTRIFWGSNEWHPAPGWLIEALDVGKQVLRTYAPERIRAWGGGPPTATEPTVHNAKGESR